MDNLDKIIKETLEAEDHALMESLEEQGLFDQFGGLFKGKLAWISVVTIVAGLVLSIIGVYAAYKFATVEDTQSMLRWGGLAWIGLMSQMMIKVWTWMRMETNRSLREIKRVELQLARLLVKIPA